MIICGAEIPLRCNEQLCALDEKSGKIVLADFDSPNLNRYSFIYLDFLEKPDIASIYQPLINGIFGGMRFPNLHFLSAWEHSPNSQRCRLMLRKKEKEQWKLCAVNNLYIATKRIDNVGEILNWLTDRRSPSFLYVGGCPENDDIKISPLLPSLQLLAKNAGQLSPSREFIDFLSNSLAGVMYFEFDDLGRVGLIFLTNDSTIASSLFDSKIITEVRVGADADTVWRLGWSVRRRPIIE